MNQHERFRVVPACIVKNPETFSGQLDGYFRLGIISYSISHSKCNPFPEVFAEVYSCDMRIENLPVLDNRYYEGEPYQSYLMRIQPETSSNLYFYM